MNQMSATSKRDGGLGIPSIPRQDASRSPCTYDMPNPETAKHVLAPSPLSLGFPAVLPTNPSTISLSLLPICFVYFLTVTVFLERPSLDMVKIAQLQAAATFLEVLWNWS